VFEGHGIVFSRNLSVQRDGRKGENGNRTKSIGVHQDFSFLSQVQGPSLSRIYLGINWASGASNVSANADTPALFEHTSGIWRTLEVPL
jgi:hypothetical protein